MDFNRYYLDQAEGNYFKGPAFQRGYGLGGAFRRFFSWFLPILKENTLPLVKNVGKEIVQSVSNIAQDAINGQKLEESSKNRISESLQKLSQVGKGYKRKRNLKNRKSLKNKRVLDIFA